MYQLTIKGGLQKSQTINHSLLSAGTALCIGTCVALACEGTYPLLCPRPRANPEGPAEVCGGVPKLMLTFGSSAFKPSCQSRHRKAS